MPNPLKPDLCYLCGQTLSEPTNDDHVPARGFFPPEIRRTYNLNNLITVPVHRACNEVYKRDEEYFIYSLYPFSLGTYVGDVMRTHIREKFHAGDRQKLVGMIMAEFDHRPSGLVLPLGQVIKRFDSKRIERVLWKIVRGLNFHHHNEVLPETWALSWSLTTRKEPGPPEHFKVFMEQLPDKEPLGDYQAVFSYRFQHFAEAGVNFHYWALLIWDSILVTMRFHDPGCSCKECVPSELAKKAEEQ